MSVWSRVRERLGGRTTEPSAEARSGRSEDTGGKPDPEAADLHSTTGTTPDDVFVGRVAGDDPGYLETGADKRAEPDTGEGDGTTTST
ncbi:hypothetical protein [Streptomyces griseomycini]|uniref:Uncharacterized protein n=1 Tax=Streptomyces griseomycini TaxID=66895 RepID=A0A7W7LZU6_9ACTN|nr:hypothetical protein [Streptomyces griseomycini]MBB4899264.1 hypothetical protein [Streptomyces griseomycini]GGQ28347.1 hypothetical protein GCM10010266_59590 [Streptomyces griseomycini]GGR35185.1 hypothetical protein GCM10015536_45950 [Streptomyces griseomycini]